MRYLLQIKQLYHSSLNTRRPPYGYIFNRCKVTADPSVDKEYLGRPWRPYACKLFINCELGNFIRPEGWHNWSNPNNEKTARYMEYNNRGAGADKSQRVAWSKQLTKKEAATITLDNVFQGDTKWITNP